jgi:hypothetical protein
MDTFRRWSHRVPPKRRERELAEELAQTLRCFADMVALHPCESCEVDLAICLRKSEALGVNLRP